MLLIYFAILIVIVLGAMAIIEKKWPKLADRIMKFFDE